MNKFCPKCGKSINKGTFCRDCNPVTLDFKPLKIKLCPSGKYFFQGKWFSFASLDEVTNKILSKSLKKKFVVVEGLEVHSDLLSKTGMKKDVSVVIVVDDAEFSIPVNVEVTVSPKLAKVGSTYFEGILQVRNVSDEVKEFIKKLLEESDNIYVNKVVELKDSVDFYFVRKRFLSQVAEKIVAEFGGFMDLNAQLFSHDHLRSKDLFRLNVVVYIPVFKRGDVVKKGDDLFLITGLGKLINCFDLKRNKKFSFKYNPDESHEFHVLKTQKTKIITIHPRIEALSNESYEVVELLNPINLAVEKDQSVVIVEDEGRAYILR